MRPYLRRLAISLLSLFAVLNQGSAAQSGQGEVVKPATEQQQKPESGAQAALESTDIVARISDYVITKEELKQRVMEEIYPFQHGGFETPKSVDVKAVLEKIIAEKAMAMEARKLGYLEDEDVIAVIKRYKDRRLANLVLNKYIQPRQSEIAVTDAEVESQIKANPKLSQAQARAMLQRQKANRIIEQYYNQLCEKFHFKKEDQNFPKAAEIQQRLLNTPKIPRQQWWITSSQIKDELTAEEKDLVLATYDGGKVTLKDWFNSLMEIAPPSRPKDMNTPAGVERLLNQTLKLAIFVAEAKATELDKEPGFVKEVRLREDENLLGKAMQEKVKDVKEPNEQQIIAYFERHKEYFGTPNILKIDQIWCQDRSTAENVNSELQAGKDFESVKKEYSLQKQSKTVETSADSEGIFFDELWKGEPNQVVGPVKGFYPEGVKWRIVKILEKKPAVLKEYSNDIKNGVKLRIMDERRNAILAEYRKELLGKYPSEIYADRIKDVDPLNIP